ncbi:MAG: ABC transporter ATP-binding protein [Pseudomonadota bacterium]
MPVTAVSSLPLVPAPTVMIGIRRLDYGGRTIFENLRLRLKGSAWTCLLGPSGVGKTSLLRLIAGIEDGALITTDDGRSLEARIAFMAQQDLLLPWLTVEDNVLLGDRLRGRGRESVDQARDILERVGLGDHSRAMPRTLSGGMRQRVALARTLMEDRPVVLMDEPFSALDAITRHRLQELAAELLHGRTVLLVTHHPLEALRLGHAIYVLGGAPVQLRELPLPPTAPPRSPTDPTLLARQGELLEELAANSIWQVA